MPEISQLPKTCRFTPLFQPNRRWPGPTGNSITYTNTARCRMSNDDGPRSALRLLASARPARSPVEPKNRSEEHTSELQSRGQLVCRLLLEKKKKDFTQLIGLYKIFTISQRSQSTIAV